MAGTSSGRQYSRSIRSRARLRCTSSSGLTPPAWHSCPVHHGRCGDAKRTEPSRKYAAGPCVGVGRLEHDKAGPYWLIADARHARRYLRSYAMDPKTNKAMRQQGILVKAATLAELAT